MYLTKLELDVSSPAVRAALWDCQKMHRLVCGLFNTSRKEAEVLYKSRVRGMLAELYLYSEIPAEPARIRAGMRLSAQRDITPWLDAMEEGGVFRFQLETAPFKKIAAEGAKNSRRRALPTQEEREAWLRRKASQNGFEILFVSEATGEKHTAHHQAEAGGSMIVDSFCYTGGLRITDPALFRQALRCGIGPGKAYGLGMLMLSGG